MIKSCWDLLIGFLLSRLKPIDHSVYMVGSNYGKRFDPNASCLINYLAQEKCTTVVVGEGEYPNAINVPRGTMRAAYYFFCSDGAFYTHSLSDLIPHGHRLQIFKRFLDFPKLVFMQHGVIGLKRVLSNGVSMANYIMTLESTFDYMVVSSIQEQDIVHGFGVSCEKIAMTGLPRFDSYHRNATPHKLVLIFFTWQEPAKLHRKLDAVLNSAAMLSLRQAGYSILTQFHDMQTDQTALQNNDVLQDAIVNCSLLITDDSSLAWDILYRGQEVIFFEPSANWLDSSAFLDARRCSDVSELNEFVSIYIGSGNKESLDFAAFSDQSHCRRVLRLVDNSR